MEPHFLRRNFWAVRRIKQEHEALKYVHDGGFVRIEPRFQFGFERRQFLCQLARVGEQAAHFNECTDYEDTHLGGLRAIQNIGRHKRAMFSESEGLMLHIMTMFQGHNL